MFQNFMQQESFSWPVTTQIPHTSPFMGHHYPYHNLHNQSYKKKKKQVRRKQTIRNCIIRWRKGAIYAQAYTVFYLPILLYPPNNLVKVHNTT